MDPRPTPIGGHLRDRRLDRRTFSARAALAASAMAIRAGLARSGAAAQEGRPDASPAVPIEGRRNDGPGASRALVLGGGGTLGIGWEAGLVDGLTARGISLAGADLIVGTSAGAVVGAHLALGLAPAAALGAVAVFGPALDAAGLEIAPEALLEAMAQIAARGSTEEGLRELGRLAAEAPTIDEDSLLGSLARLKGEAWPSSFVCTAIDAETGAFRVWDAGSGAPLRRAVASSVAAPFVLPLVTVDGRRYMDGGVRSHLNADLAAGRERVVAVSCFPLGAPGGTPAPGAPEAELEAVRARAEAVAVIEPGAEFLALSGGGANLLDPGRAGEAYDAGLRQARAELDRIRDVWNG